MLELIPMKAGQRASLESLNVTGVGEYLYRNDLLLKKLYGSSVRLISLFYFGHVTRALVKRSSGAARRREESRLHIETALGQLQEEGN